ncbi:hypothetical protein BJ742DRAFT_21072 [Cladochytrium replicatum]|nr:hypothetical protein BJ742DRAFT_21072 [Cladochytrium replicatum]
MDRAHDERETVEIGVIGFGGIGAMCANAFIRAGWKRVNVCDQPERFDELRERLAEKKGITVHKDGHGVSRCSDFVLYCVEASRIDGVVKNYGPSTKVGAVVGGQTSVKEPEIAAFEKYLPPDVQIVSCHSLHGPNVNSRGQPLVIVRHRCEQKPYERVLRILAALESQMVFLGYKEHDRITADTQAVTHVAFQSMGTAWKTRRSFPWEIPNYAGGIENVKIAMTMRIFANKWHVYAGLAIMNPTAHKQVQQYAQSVSDLFKLMIQEKAEEFTERIMKAKEYVFGSSTDREPILLSDSLLDQFSLSAIPREKRKPNSHLSLLAMVDCWYQCKTNPYGHLICQTPPFRLLLGITEYCFRNSEILNESIHAALYDKEIRADDMEFYSASQGWVECITRAQSHDYYRSRFEEVTKFFEGPRMEGALKMSEELVAVMSRKLGEPK